MDFKIDLSKFKIDFSKLNINFDFFAKPLTMSISIDDDFKTIKFLKYDTEEKTYTYNSQTYKGKPFNDNFYEMLKGVLSLQQYERAEKVAFILPDKLFVNDTIKLPYIQKTALNTSLGLALDALYGENHNIEFNNFTISQTKQHAIFNVVGIRKDILNKIYDCLEDCSVPISEVTFASNATVNGAIALNPRLRNANFILLDIKNGFGIQVESNIVPSVISSKTEGITFTDKILVNIPAMAWYNARFSWFGLGLGAGFSCTMSENHPENVSNTKLGLAAGVKTKFFVNDNISIVAGVTGNLDCFPNLQITSNGDSTTYKFIKSDFSRNSIFASIGLEYRIAL